MIESTRQNQMSIGELEEQDKLKEDVCAFCGTELSPLSPNRCLHCGKVIT